MRGAAAILLLSAFAGAQDLLIRDVTVLPMEGGRRLPGRSVVVRDGTIDAVVEGAPRDPPGIAIDGTGLYLLPGLCDMHVHNWYEEEHVLFLANGVTTVRNLWGTPQHLRWRKEIASGERTGPRIFTSGPILDGAKPIWEGSVPVATPEEARRVVAAQAEAGYDAIKVYNGLRADVYAALVAEARRRGMRVEGHVPYEVGLERALRARQDSIEHLEGYGAWEGYFVPAQVRAWAERTAGAGTWNCPTLVVYRKFVAPEEARLLLAAPEMRFVPPRLLATWDPGRDFRIREMSGAQFARNRRSHALKEQTVRLLHEAGARLLLGTDSANPNVVAGWSAHEELALLVEAGLRPWEALACATRNAGEYLKQPLGRVEPGYLADLLLVEGDPFADVRHAARIVGVVAGGRWFPRARLDGMLTEVAASYARPRDRFAGLPALDGPRYEVRWNDLVVAEERFALGADGSYRVQLANDPPQGERVDATFGPDDRLRLLWRGPGGEGGEVAPSRATLHGVSSMALWTMLRPRLAAGAAFELMEFSSQAEGRFAGVLVQGRAAAERVIDLSVTRPDGVYLSRLTYGDDGLPSEMVSNLQQGTVVVRRIG